jgi:hypothetical protein
LAEVEYGSVSHKGNLVRSLSYEAGPMWHRKREEKSEGEESEAGAAVKVE